METHSEKRTVLRALLLGGFFHDHTLLHVRNVLLVV